MFMVLFAGSIEDGSVRFDLWHKNDTFIYLFVKKGCNWLFNERIVFHLSSVYYYNSVSSLFRAILISRTNIDKIPGSEDVLHL